MITLELGARAQRCLVRSGTAERPGLPVRILKDLAALLGRDGYGSITEAVGAG